MSWLTSDLHPHLGLAARASQVLSALAQPFAPRRDKTRRTSLAALLEFEDSRLADLGLVRQDIVEAMRQPAPGATLARRRARRASAWLNGLE